MPIPSARAGRISLFIVPVILGLGVFAVHAGRWPVRPNDIQCDRLDARASAAVAAMVAHRNTFAEAHLGDAVFRLRRARNNCRFGMAALARGDYEALIDGRLERPFR